MKLKKTFTVDTIIKEEASLNNFLNTIPNCLGINLCAVKDIEIEAQDNEYGQLESLKINFIPSVDPDGLASIKINGGPWPWLTREEKGVEVIKSLTDITWQERFQDLIKNIDNVIRFANARDIKDTEEFKQFKENIKKLLD